MQTNKCVANLSEEVVPKNEFWVYEYKESGSFSKGSSTHGLIGNEITVDLEGEAVPVIRLYSRNIK